jgi:hypothetical protein
MMLHLNIWLLQHVEIHGKRCSPWAPELVVLTLSLLKYMTTSICVFGMTPRCCKVSAMYFMLGESPNEGPNDHIWLHNCQANLCMFLRFSNFLWERERERDHGQHPNFEISIILKLEWSNWFYWGLGFWSKPHPYFLVQILNRSDILELWSMFHQNFWTTRLLGHATNLLNFQLQSNWRWNRDLEGWIRAKRKGAFMDIFVTSS